MDQSSLRAHLCSFTDPVRHLPNSLFEGYAGRVDQGNRKMIVSRLLEPAVEPDVIIDIRPVAAAAPFRTRLQSLRLYILVADQRQVMGAEK